ncbi:MAG: hypothetical protein AABX32_01105 [Nanoarchaeota archaeon]
MGGTIIYLDSNGMHRQDITELLQPFGLVVPFPTEQSFREVMDAYKAMPHGGGLWPKLFVLEQRVAWAEPDPHRVQAPPEVLEGGSTLAGTRCYDYLRQVETGLHLPPSPVIVYHDEDVPDIETALGARGISLEDANVRVLEKNYHTKPHELLDLVRRLLQQQPR